MPDPDFLGLDRILWLHQHLIETYGGDDGLRDAGLLISAIEQPRAMFDGTFLYRDHHEMAAAYLFHLVRNHPFVDGNKRIGAAAAIVFLDLNGITLVADEDGLVDITVRTADGRASKSEISTFLRHRTVDP